MATETESRPVRVGPAFRQGDRVMPLELFFDLVFVLAITQCTTLMSHDTTWSGLGHGILVLALLWWSWAAYAWLTSLLDPEEGAVRLVLFAAMAGFLIAAICVPKSFGSLGTEFAVAYGAVRAAHIALFFISSHDDPELRRSTLGLAGGTALGITLLVVGSLLDPGPRAAVWGLALVLDMLEPYLFGSEGWHLIPGHFAERHGLIILIALGESIVAIGVGAAGTMTWGIAGAATLGIALVAALWWLYFDVVSLVSARRLASAPEGRIRNELARDSYSYIHFLMVAGIILAALGLKITLRDVTAELDVVPAFSLLAGVALYLLGMVAFRFRHVKTVNWRRLGLALILFALLPAATALPAIATLAIVATLLWTLVVLETRSYGEGRARVRHGDAFPTAR
jgi:low temperature requirement protein LtrA